MKIYADTGRIILREIMPEDLAAMHELDSDPAVHRYLGGRPNKSLQETADNIAFIRQQYIDNGIGRWAIMDKHSNEFMGWGGLKFITTPINDHVNFYEVGYRLIRKYWGLGFATEAARASLKYAFEVLLLENVYAMAHQENSASIHTLQKSGLEITGQFEYQGLPCYWFEIDRNSWQLKSLAEG